MRRRFYSKRIPENTGNLGNATRIHNLWPKIYKNSQWSIRIRFVRTARDHSTRVDNAWTFKCRMWLVVRPVVSTFLSRFLLTRYERVVRCVKTKHVLCVYLSLSVVVVVVIVVVVVRVVVCLCCLFWLCVSLCCQSFSGSVTVTMAGSTQTAQTGNTGHATVNTNSQTHTSSEQQLPVPTPLHYPCKICGK